VLWYELSMSPDTSGLKAGAPCFQLDFHGSHYPLAASGYLRLRTTGSKHSLKMPEDTREADLVLLNGTMHSI
jgi:hypothetical protein